MEVHHHPDLHHKKKSFREYFLEFLMIFIAVTMGFLAENLREHISNRSKEKEYIRGFIRNVEDDTANLRRIIHYDDRQVKGIDSFLLLRHADLKLDKNVKQFYLLAIHNFYSSAAFTSNNTTLQQLKSTGDYRLIVMDHVADSLSNYDKEIQDITGETGYYNEYFREVLSRLDGITDMSVFADTTYMKNEVFTSKLLPALDADNSQLRVLFNKVFDFRMITSSYGGLQLTKELANATRLIAFLKKKYDIQDD